MMKKIFLLVFAFLLLFSEGFSQEEDYTGDWLLAFQSEVGKRPAAIFHDADVDGYDFFTKWFVYCAGYDANHNGILDDGDEAPSLWAFSIEIPVLSSKEVPVLATVHFNGWLQYTDPVKIMDFDFEDVELPVRLAWIPNSQDGIYKFYLPESNKLIEVTVNFIQSHISGEMEVNSTKKVILDEAIHYVSTGKNPYNIDILFLSKRNPSDNTGEVLIYNLMTNEIEQTLQAGAGVQMTVQRMESSSLLILNDKMGEDTKGTLMNYKYVSLPDAKFKYELNSELELPNSPSHIDASGKGEIVVTSSDSDTLQIISIISGELEFSENLIIKNDSQLRQTTISDGTYFDNKYEYYTTSYKGYVYFYNKPQVTGESELTYRLKAYGQAECMMMNSSIRQMAIATPYDESGEVSNNLTVYGKMPLSVNDNTNNNIIVYPNPASDFISISIDSEVDLLTHEVQILDLLGLVVSKSELQDGNNRIDISTLQRGTYFIKIGDRVEKFVKM